MNKFLLSLGLIISLFACNSNTPAPEKTEPKTPEPKQMPARGQIKGPAGLLFYDDAGKGGIPVVFVHSYGGSTVHWKEQLEYTRRDRRAIALDLRGHGQSDAPANMDYSVNSLTADIAAVVDSLQLDKFVLVGHSMGGAAAIAYAGMHPDRVAGLVMVGAPGKTADKDFKQVMGQLESDAYDKTMDGYMKRILGGSRPYTDSIMRAGMNKFSRETNIAIIRRIFEYDPLPALQKYNGPKLIISSELESKQPDALAKQAPTVTNKTIMGTSHWIHMDKPQEFYTVLEEFLKKV